MVFDIQFFIKQLRLYYIFYIFCSKYFIHFEEICIQELTNLNLKRHHSGKVNAKLIGCKLTTTNNVNRLFTKFNLENTCTFQNPVH